MTTIKKGIVNTMETNALNDVNPFYNLPVVDLLIKQQEMEEKISLTYGLQGADTMVNILRNLKYQLDEEIDRRMYTGEINDNVIFIFEDYLKRKDAIETEAMNQLEQVQAMFEYGDISETEMIKRTDEINKNKEKGLADLVKSIK